MSRFPALGPVLAAGAILVAASAVAAGLSGADAAKARMDHMKAMGGAAKALREQLQAGHADPAIVKVQTAKILAGAKDLPTWFPVGSGKSAEPKSHALDVVWTDAAGFDGKAKALLAAAQKLDAVGQSGDAAGVLPAFKDVGAACKGCHEKFEEKDKT